MTYDIMTTRKIRKTLSIKNPAQLHEFLKRYAKSRQEQFFVITLNGAHEVISIHIATIGLMNKTIIHPREVFIHAIKDNSYSIIIAHNHPSGNVNPSPEDEEMTKRLSESAQILGIHLLDHLIISKHCYYSFRQEENILKSTLLDQI